LILRGGRISVTNFNESGLFNFIPEEGFSPAWSRSYEFQWILKTIDEKTILI